MVNSTRKLDFSEGDKMIDEEYDRLLQIRQATEVVQRLAGSVKVPAELLKLDPDEAITQAKLKK